MSMFLSGWDEDFSLNTPESKKQMSQDAFEDWLHAELMSEPCTQKGCKCSDKPHTITRVIHKYRELKSQRNDTPLSATSLKFEDLKIILPRDIEPGDKF